MRVSSVQAVTEGIPPHTVYFCLHISDKTVATLGFFPCQD